MIARIKKYIQGIHLEWQRVSKPDAKEVQGSTVTVLVASALLGLFIWLVDGNAVYPKWDDILGLILLVALPIAVFSVVRDWESRRLIATVVACVPLVVALVSQYVLKTSLEGFGMAFLRALFIR